MDKKSEVMNNFREVVTEEVLRDGLSRFARIRNVNNNSLCASDVVPSVQEYLSAINVYGIIVITAGALVVLVVLLTFIDTLRYIMNNSSSRVKAHTAFIIGVYPVVALATFCATIVPRSHLLAEAVTQGIFMGAMYQLFCLLVAYCGGEAELIRRVKPALLNPRVGPCCCWPCCRCLPFMDLNKNRLMYLRFMVLQLPVVQGLVYLTLLVMWAERESLYHINYFYVQPLIIFSILFGIWAMLMTLQLLKDVLKDHSTVGKFFVLQMVLIFGKMQTLIIKVGVGLRWLPCHPPLPPAVFGNMIYNCLMLIEMMILGLIARKLYKRELPEQDEVQSNNLTKTAQICISVTQGSMVSSVIQERNNNSLFVHDNNKQLDDITQAENANVIKNGVKI